MLNHWNNAIITDINLAMYVSPETIKTVHTDRAFHGLVINDAIADKRIHFADGTVLHTGPHDVHYLPKHADYRVEALTKGGCWAINFDLLEDPHQPPFNLHLSHPETVLEEFKSAVRQYSVRPAMCDVAIRRHLYGILLKLQQEQDKKYMPRGTQALIAPAMEEIATHYFDRELSVRELAAACGISEVYFRRIFTELHGVSPVQYIKRLKLTRAQELLQSGLYAVREVSALAGFGDECYFSREFKKQIGMSPKEYEKASRL